MDIIMVRKFSRTYVMSLVFLGTISVVICEFGEVTGVLYLVRRFCLSIPWSDPLEVRGGEVRSVRCCFVLLLVVGPAWRRFDVCFGRRGCCLLWHRGCPGDLPWYIYVFPTFVSSRPRAGRRGQWWRRLNVVLRQDRFPRRWQSLCIVPFVQVVWSFLYSHLTTKGSPTSGALSTSIVGIYKQYGRFVPMVT
jgi:hypothetical protein